MDVVVESVTLEVSAQLVPKGTSCHSILQTKHAAVPLPFIDPRG
ncbi:hypothetical protein [Streptomyces sp. NPDC017964]